MKMRGGGGEEEEERRGEGRGEDKGRGEEERGRRGAEQERMKEWSAEDYADSESPLLVIPSCYLCEGCLRLRRL